MKVQYRLVGLSKSGTGTMELLDTDRETFWGTFDMPKDRYDALFRWASDEKGFWSQAWIAICEVDKLTDDGCPINAFIKEVKEWDLPYKPYPAYRYDNNNRKLPIQP